MDWKALSAHWRDGAVEDLETADILFEKRKLRQCLFFVHLALEKALKAIVVDRTQDHSPKIHNLDRLVQLAEIAISEEKLADLTLFNRYCMQGRYPDLAPTRITLEEAEQRLAQGKEFLEWLLK